MQLFRRKSDLRQSAAISPQGQCDISPDEVDKILQSLREQVDAGVYFCELSMFRQIYQRESHNRENSEKPLFIVSMTLVDEFGNVPENHMLACLNKNMKTILKNNLRKGDVVTDYSDYQLLLILPEADKTDCAHIIERLQNEFEKNAPIGIFLKCGYETL